MICLRGIRCIGCTTKLNCQSKYVYINALPWRLLARRAIARAAGLAGISAAAGQELSCCSKSTAERGRLVEKSFGDGYGISSGLKSFLRIRYPGFALIFDFSMRFSLSLLIGEAGARTFIKQDNPLIAHPYLKHFESR